MIPQIKDIVEYFETEHRLSLTPAGRWQMNTTTVTQGDKTVTTTKKEPIDAKRYDHLEWDSAKYQNDNMARLFIDKPHLLLVLDIDGSPVHFNDDGTVTVIDLDITIPYGLYTTTTAENKFHFYYRVTEEQQNHLANRIKGLHDTTIDIFTYGTVFEGHTFSEAHALHRGEILSIPDALYDDVRSWQNEKDLAIGTAPSELGLTSNIQRLNIIKMYLADELSTNKQWNTFFRLVMPAEYQPEKKRKIVIDNFKLSYDLVNKLAVKLTTTSELDFNEHVVPTIHKLLVEWKIDPKSSQTNKQLSMILPSLPQHESILPYDHQNDLEELDTHMKRQTGTNAPLFRTAVGGKLMYIELDKATTIPVEHNGNYFLDKGFAQVLHPELNRVDEEGRVTGWDDQGLPVIYHYNNPYKPAYEWDYDRMRHNINLYTPTEYIQRVEQKKVIGEDNLIMKTVVSIMSPQYLDIYLAYSAQVLFGSSSPTMVLWIAAQKTELGGSGKSVATLELFSMMLGGAAAAVDSKTMSSGWGDVITGSKILSLEDMPDLSFKEWELVYANIKQQNTNSYRKLNMKGSSVITDRVSVAITGSTNFRPKLNSSDRRFFCIEPAHLHGITDPLSEEERLALSKALSSHEYNEEIQEYVDYLYYIYTQGFSPEINKALFIEAPQTIYRKKWIDGGETNTQTVLNNLSHPIDLLAQCTYDTEDNLGRGILAQLFSMVILTYNAKSGKSAVSWRWFEQMFPFISDKFKDDGGISKDRVGKVLHTDIKNVGVNYSSKWKTELPLDFPPEWAMWPTEGVTFILTPDEYTNYRRVIAELRGV